MIASCPPPLAVLTFGLPALAWGALALGLPVIIHLVLRQRPRRQILPTMRFLIQAHQTSTRAHRLKYLILLASRMALILLIVGLLMKTGCAPSGADPKTGRMPTPANGPVAAVIVIDDSASMQYRYQGRTRLEDAITWARNLVADTERFPPGSELTVVTGSTAGATGPGWTRDLNAAGRLVQEIKPGWHDRPVASLLRQAYGLFSTATLPNREVYLFTDLTQTSWQEPPPSPPKELSTVFVLDAGRNENRNLMLGIPEVPQNTLAPNAPAACQIRLRASQTPTGGTITLTVDGQARDRRQATPPGPDSETTVPFTLPPLAEGPHALTFTLEPTDALPFDNERFACVSVGRAPGLVVVGEETAASVAGIVSAMIAPPAQPVEERRFSLRRIAGPALAGSPLDHPLAVVLADPAGLTPGGWQSLARYVSAGGTLLVIPGPNTTAEIYAGQELLPAAIRGVVPIANFITLAAADLSYSYLKPFMDPGIDSINDRQVYRRLDLAPPRADTTVVAPFSDRAPAILDRRIGAGRVIQFAFSPEREWSQFGTQAGPMIVLLHSIFENLSPKPENIESLTAGRLATHRMPESQPAEYAVQGPEGTPASIPARNGTATLTTDRPGHYRLTAAPAVRPVLLYSVNVAESESEMDRLPDELIQSLFPQKLARIVHQPGDLPSRSTQGGGAVSWTVPLALALVVLLWLETLFANRFYAARKPTPANSEPQLPGPKS